MILRGGGVVPPDNEIWYTSTDGSVINPSNYWGSSDFGVKITSNTYSDGRGVITCGGDIAFIGDRAYNYSPGLKSIILPNSVLTIGAESFASNGADLIEVGLPKNLTSIGSKAFHYCSSLTEITIPNSVTSIGENVFYECSSLSKANIPTGLTSIPKSMFMFCKSLPNITIPDNITSIGEYAFRGCESLTEIIIPSSVKSIEADAFSRCSNLSAIYVMRSTPPTGGLYMFDDIASNAKIYVPAGSGNAYKTAQYWSKYADKIVEM